jgi:hypothetical protein
MTKEHLASLKAMLVRERRWLLSDPCDEREGNLAALRYAISMLEESAVEPNEKPMTPSEADELTRRDYVPGQAFNEPTCKYCAADVPAQTEEGSRFHITGTGRHPCTAVNRQAEPSHEPDYLVQCRCGWKGYVSKLKTLPEFKRGCPECSTEFLPIFAAQPVNRSPSQS